MPAAFALTGSLSSLSALARVLVSESSKGGWKTRGGGEHTVKPLPKNMIGSPPPPYDTIPPRLFGDSLSFKRKEAPTRATPISEASKSGFGEHALQYVFTPQIHVTFLPSHQPLPNSLGPRHALLLTVRKFGRMPFMVLELPLVVVEQFECVKLWLEADISGNSQLCGGC